MSRAEISAIARILSDPTNEDRTAEEVAELVFEALRGTVKTLRADEVDRVAAKAIAAVQTDDAGSIPARVLDAIDARRAQTHRLAVVGQIRYGPQDETHTVVLGPFSSRGILDSREKFLQALEGPSSARTAGLDLAWDPATKTGQGRFMLAPAFSKVRDAWDFYRGPAKRDSEPMNMLVPPPEHIALSLERWKPGLWAREHHARP
ncbi:hypothetical protein [Streptomyces tsukubensis]|uniref:hypothetical protein n=1 Tax=Streptomyces tsukubensis TaxID=83656 RepID=UPI003450841F